MSSENENEQSNNNSSGVKKQVRIVNDLVSSDDCPRLSVRPGRDSYSGYKYSVWAGVPTIPCKPKPHRISTSGNSKLKQRINKVNKSLCVSGFFRAQLRMMKSSKHHRNKGYSTAGYFHYPVSSVPQKQPSFVDYDCESSFIC
ncbi:uncharacterized protein LOC141674255 isoform X2 [Apium graveolens]|uniref:uncharacterized protein LOC141674255 isoform X2 n=1 Tax=Apium graveolens TaxID=4045 RepID=UPI003D7A2796